jgi:integrase
MRLRTALTVADGRGAPSTSTPAACASRRRRVDGAVGEPVTAIQAWLGHGDLKTTQRYMHCAPAADEAEHVERAFAIGGNAEATSWPRGTVAS